MYLTPDDFMLVLFVNFFLKNLDIFEVTKTKLMNAQKLILCGVGKLMGRQYLF